MREQRTDFQAWLWGEVVLTGLLGASLALFIAYPVLRTQYEEPRLLLVLRTAMALAGLLVAALAAVRFSVERRRMDLLLASGFLVGSLSTAGFGVIPMLGGGNLPRPDGWAALIGGLLGQALIAIAPFLHGRTRSRDWAIANSVVAAGVLLAVAWSVLQAHASSLS
ncbi:MAG TPA: hypothetical protein VE088_06725, partial [Gaiellaceae bacterium]|nr:hypothetical protein [Gaiellaceae bacterium]